MSDRLVYLSTEWLAAASEAVAGALPRGRFSPQRAPFGLYAEKFSNTAFTSDHVALFTNKLVENHTIVSGHLPGNFEPTTIVMRILGTERAQHD